MAKHATSAINSKPTSKNHPRVRESGGQLAASDILARTKCLESLVLERLELPDQVSQFEQLEELSKCYAIEAPYVSRSQIELVFDVYDGHKLANIDQCGQSSHTNVADQDQEHQYEDQDHDQEEGAELGGQHNPADGNYAGCQQDDTTEGNHEMNSARGQQQSNNRRHQRSGGNFSWCKLLFNHHQNNNNGKVGHQGSRITSCLTKSDTSQELGGAGQLSASSSAGLTWLHDNYYCDYSTTCGLPGSTAKTASNEAISALAGLAPDLDDDLQAQELKAEVLQMIGPLLDQLRRNSSLGESTRPDYTCLESMGLEQQAILLQDSGSLLDPSTTCRVSVCLFDKRPRKLTSAGHDADNGRRWAQAQRRLQELRWKLRLSAASSSNLEAPPDRSQLERKLCRLVGAKRIKLSTPPSQDPYHQWSSSGSGRKRLISEKLNKEQMEQLINLTKVSLNHLIDAQLLLRNKLTSEQQQQQSASLGTTCGGPTTMAAAQTITHHQSSSSAMNEYDLLLKNNFNLLKIWQNLEETKRLACFVCEPIKANLSDLFWFSRQQQQYQPSVPFASDHNTTASESSSSLQILSSPLVSLDAVQVKRGLMQVSNSLISISII